MTATIRSITPQPTDVQWTAAHESVTVDLTRVEAKAGAVLSAVSLPLAAAAVAAPALDLAGPALAMTLAGLALLAAAILLVLVVIRPAGMVGRPPGGSWLYWATVDDPDIARDVATDHRALQLGRRARILAHKMRRLRQAVTLLIAGVAILTGAALLSLI
ncbi:hypothetical protein SAMN06297387_13141 [Streptomyces zhaozhouensis]|uniref:Pycsar effector protein domain-containing protein n=1 Tax=Streptomyces zhaozhouensis TaxID=1300267 RepID=A0A286E9E8_9ACTN|nr:Pycsar system effector family protein [Streptomyces zhaozhouensis]SOD67510.1 hypothetical protein SAMN06297387_13141 [Streptomyces zhaozhouensis]